jgi:DnaJ-class molecular chaperone
MPNPFERMPGSGRREGGSEMRTCQSCGGRGSVSGQRCSRCNGTGKVANRS